MTTFTTEDRIIAEKDGSVTINVEPIPFAGMVTLTETVPKPAAWFYQYPGETGIFMCADAEAMKGIEGKGYIITPLYTHPAKTLTDEDIAKVVHELNQKANTPERWVTAMQIGAETIIQLRNELRKAQE
jgi:hypothetical protein